jgi:dihydroxyacetone kinase
MKKLINRREDVVEEMVQGLAVLQPGCARLPGHKALICAEAAQAHRKQVAILSGGGSGHEPAHAGYIGAGMLSAAVAGEVFTSPSSDTVFAAIKAVSGKPGALLVVKNYTGDRLNFGLAAEMARAEGLPVEMVIVDDDVALRGTAQATGARGLAGTVFIHKLLGAAAAEGKNLDELLFIGKAAVASLGTMGVSFSAGTSPAVGKPSFELGEQEMELGLGIHGEPGVNRMPVQAADQLTETLLSTILQHGKFSKPVAVMVNNLGATTTMELAIVARHAVRFLGSKGFTVERIFAGTFLSSLDMAGISISVLGLNDERLRWLDASTTAPAWPNVLKQRPGKPAVQTTGVSTRSREKDKKRDRGRLQGFDRCGRRADGDGPRYRRWRPWRQHGACGQCGPIRAELVSAGRYRCHAQSARTHPTEGIGRIIGATLRSAFSALRQRS